MTPQEALNRLIEQREIFHDEMLSIMRQIMSGQLTPVQIAGIIMGLRVKGETVGEITAAAQVMRELSAKVNVSGEPHLVDTCGTGGDSMHTFNISTTSAFVTAAAGAKVAKHGGRSVSSSCGSADVLEALEINVNLNPVQVAQSIREIGIGFMFAPNYHSAMKYAAPVRKELGVRTLFNILGPLTNPAGAPNQVIDVFHRDLVGIHARVLQALGSRHALVVHGKDGLDEFSISGETAVAELKNGRVEEYTLDAGRFGVKLAPLEAIQAKSAEESKNMLLSVLDNRPGPARDIVALNAGAAIYVSGLVDSVESGVRKANEVIASGAARAKLKQLVEFTVRFKAA
jgi:anthranilate phosphoribosyltransferase